MGRGKMDNIGVSFFGLFLSSVLILKEINEIFFIIIFLYILVFERYKDILVGLV